MSGSGSLIVITGPMFSGKTTRLLEHLRQHSVKQESVILVRPANETRYSSDSVVSHAGTKLPAVTVPADGSCTDIILDKAKGADVVGFDELQLWSTEAKMPALLRSIADSGKTVYVTVLSCDFTGMPFESTGNILELANKIYHAEAVCAKCGGNATYNQRVDEKGEPIVDGPIILVGGKDRYEARCESCFVYPNSMAKVSQN